MYETAEYCSSGEFRADGNWIHPARVIDSYELIYVLEGSFSMTENRKAYRLRPGVVLLLGPGKRHRGMEEEKGVRFFWAHFCAAEPPHIPKYTECRDAFQVTLLFRQLLHYSNTAGYPREGCNYLIRLLLLELSRGEQDEAPLLLREAAEWIRIRRDRSIKAADVAEAMGYNGDYLSRMFQKTWGVSLKEYIDRTRIDHICQRLLYEDASLKELAWETGFQDYKYFLKFFKAHMDMSPTEFKNVYSRTHLNLK